MKEKNTIDIIITISIHHGLSYVGQTDRKLATKISTIYSSILIVAIGINQ